MATLTALDVIDHEIEMKTREMQKLKDDVIAPKLAKLEELRAELDSLQQVRSHVNSTD